MQDEVKPVATSLLGDPLAEAGFNFLLGHGSICAGIFNAAPHLVENVKMILNVLE
jgi:hypothetical protein